jgi:hypothetical protein
VKTHLGIFYEEAGRLRLRAAAEGLLDAGQEGAKGRRPKVQPRLLGGP